MKDKKEKATPLLAILKELIVEKGFDPALMEEPFFIDQINTFDKDKTVYSKDEANNILNMIRKINANTATQVNADKIGVLIIGETPCTVSYSVDGQTWTEHPTTLTDMNNVINNIPRYMYLKFSKDVQITVE